MGYSAKKKPRPKASVIDHITNRDKTIVRNMEGQSDQDQPKKFVPRLFVFLMVIIMISLLNYYTFFSSNAPSPIHLSDYFPSNEPPIDNPPPKRRRVPTSDSFEQNSLKESSAAEKENKSEDVSTDQAEKKLSRIQVTGDKKSELLRDSPVVNQKEHTTTETNDTIRDVANDGEKTLALLYPTGLFGGYRNQVMRFVAFITYAFQNNYSQIFLPSLLWATQIGDGYQKQDSWQPVPHDLLFDVDYWNSLGELPRLVSNLTDSDCWKYPSPNQLSAQNESISRLSQATLERGFLSPISDFARRVASRELVVNPRKIDLLENVSKCTRPAAYGGGRGAGRLWYDYGGHQQKRKNGNKDYPFNADSKVLKALRPKKLWRNVAKECVEKGGAKNYLALHARLELEMMNHRCGADMERSLTKIFEMVENVTANTLDSLNLSGVFLAVSRSGMELQDKRFYKGDIKAIADENVRVLYQVAGNETSAGSGLNDGLLPVFECGKDALQRYYENHPNSIDYGSTLESIINFYIATEASVFVGVSRSSYSTDIWTTRYFQGKGDQNYEYTKDGIVKVANGGLPPPHSDCPSRPKKG